MLHRVAFLGFSESERHALASYFRLAHNRSPGYEQVPTLTDADFLVADADHGPSVHLVLAIERLPETVFVGAHQPPGCTAWTLRPLDALQVMRELDTLVARAQAARAPRDEGDGPQTTIIQLARRREAEAAQAARVTYAGQPLLGDLPFNAPEPGAVPAVAPVDMLTLRDLPSPAQAAAEVDITWPDDEVLAQADVSVPIPPPPAPAQRPLRRPRLPTPPEAEMPAAGGVVVGGPAAPLAPTAERAPAAQAPQAAAAAPATTRAPKAPKATRAPPPGPPPRVLLVDDSAIAQRFLESRLSRWKLEIDRASNSQAAVALLARDSYDIVFVDVELGEQSELDGLTLCQRIKHTPALMNSMVVIVSAHHSELDRVRGALAGCDAYLAKPLDEAELQRLMKRQGAPMSAAAGAAQG